MEHFKTISDAPDYLIGDEGTVLSMKQQPISIEKVCSEKGTEYKRNLRVIVPNIHNGYKRVHLINRQGIRYNENVHVLVAESFIKGRNREHSSTYVVNHIDGNKLNNCVSNLEFITQKENVNKAIDCGLRKKHIRAVGHRICDTAGNLFLESFYISMARAAEVSGLSADAIKWRADHHQDGWFYPEN